MTEGTMLNMAMERSNLPPKAIAAEIDYSVDALYKACQGKRRLPQDINAKQKLAGISFLAGLAIALEGTGYRIFTYLDGDRHPQTMIRRVEKEDAEADEALRPIAWRTIDKQSAEDLTPEDVVALKAAAMVAEVKPKEEKQLPKPGRKNLKAVDVTGEIDDELRDKD